MSTSNNIETITDKNFKEFMIKCPNYKRHFITIKRWLAEKKRTLPCYEAYGFDSEGQLYLKEFLVKRKYWGPIEPDNTAE
tara:strand:+ start:537 stop:776 length:240 start_codon:yes stop_codon:yes gene_type:complete